MTGVFPRFLAQAFMSTEAVAPLRGLLGEGADVDTSWLAFGLAAEAVIAICIAAQWIATHRAGRFTLLPWMVYLVVAATFMLAVYAWMFQQWVFLLSQLLFALIGLRLLAWSREMQELAKPGDSPRLPVVAPDSAELKLPLKDPPSSIKPTSRASR